MSILDGLVWQPVAHTPDAGGLPAVTHDGVLEIAGHRLRCYRLDDGRAIIHADDFREFFGDLGEASASEVPVTATDSNPFALAT